MGWKITAIFLAAVGLASASPALTHTPAKGSAERRAILDALRPAIEARLGKNVEFVVTEMKVEGSWALVLAKPRRKGGAEINWRSYYAPSEWEQMDGLDVSAVLEHRNKRWNLIEHAIGATDAWYCGLHSAQASFLNC